MKLSLFRNPPSQYRSAPFWSWNDRLTDEELVRQVRMFHTVGIGGFFMHSRVGLLTPYLSREWMQRVRTVVAAARERGMKAWLYDEDSYPSGFAGGMVPSLGAAYRCKTLKHEIASERPTMRDGTVAVYRCRLDDRGRPVSAARDDGLPPAPGEHFLHCYWAIPPDSGWYNDATYIDTLNRDAADAFLRITHDAYAEALGDDFGDTIPGIFTDEPRLEGPMPWTESFPAEFRSRKGYDIRDHLPALLYRIGKDWAKARYDYWDVVTDLFLESFCRPVGDWCDAHGLALTGHFWEHTYPSPEHQGDFLAPLATMQLPGIDCLGCARPEKPQTQFGYVAMCKEAASVAHQMGRPQVLSEAYGGAGWDFGFADQKWYWDWHLVLGVNLLCQHLSLYSLRGCRKRDYPPSFIDHQPWWHQYRTLGDYVGRMGYALSQGRFCADTLVLHPCEGSWIEHDRLDPEWAAPRRKAALDALWELTQALTEVKCDYDLGSERLMATHARIRDGELRLGKQSYRTVILPRMISMRGSTLGLLSRFLEAGGTIVTTGETPTYLDGGRSRIVERFFEQESIVHCRPTRAALGKCLAKVSPPAVSIADARGRNIPAIYAHRRILRGRDLYFLASMDRERTYRATVTVPDAGEVELWDGLTGQVHPLRSRKRGRRRSFELQFPPNASYLVTVGKTTKGATPRPAAPKKATRRIELKRSWTHRRLGPNALVLDFPQHRFGKGRWGKRRPVHEVQQRACERFGIDYDPGNRGTQFWKAYQRMRDMGPEARVGLRYEFVSKLSDAAGLRLVVECGDRFEARVNGKAVAFDGWWRDRSFRTAEIGHAVKKGANRVELAIDFRQDVELEASFLIGDFALDKALALVDEKRTLRTGDWTRQGYPFYADAMACEQTVALDRVPKAARLCFERLDAIVTRVEVNGVDAGLVFQQPLQIDVADLLEAGDNQIVVEVYPSLRNLLGPLHNAAEQPRITGPWHFFGDWTDDYRLVPYGIAGPVWLETSSP